jgi:hypothetical protein
MKRPVRAIAASLIALGAVGCAGPARTATTPAPAAASTVPEPSEAQVQSLRERAAAYWAARMSGDDRTQWELLEPRGQGRLTPQEYATERKGIKYLGYQIEDATIDGYFATVKVRLLFQPLLQRMVSVPVQTVLMDDPWVRVRGTWYRQLDDRQAPRREP